MNNDRHLILVSADAFVFEDLEYVKNLPNFKRILDNGARVEKVRTIYPTITHPVHATIMTGAPAGVTGIVNNAHFEPGKLQTPWYNRLDEIKCDTILHAAKRAGLTTAVCLFPLTMGGGEYIDYLVPGLMQMDVNGRENEPIEVYKDFGLTPCLEDIVLDAIDKFGFSLAHPQTDEFATYIAAEIIRRHKPNLLLTHPGFIDSARHRSGVFSDFVCQSLRDTDRWIGMLWDAVCDAGIEDSTDIVVLGDHGQINATRRINTNVFFADKGYIETDEDGNMVDWKVCAHSTGFSSYVYLKDDNDLAFKKEVYDLLCGMAEENLYGFDQVLTREEVKQRYGLDGDFAFVLETDGFSTFSDGWVRPVVAPLDLTDYKMGKASHGYLPEKGPQPTFIAAGPSFKKGAVVEFGSVLNHAPTCAAALGIELRDAVGTKVSEILN